MTNDEAMELLLRLEAQHQVVLRYRESIDYDPAVDYGPADWEPDDDLYKEAADMIRALLAQPNAASQSHSAAEGPQGDTSAPASAASWKPEDDQNMPSKQSAAPDSGMPEEPTRFIPVWHKKFMAADRDGRFVLAEDYDTLRSAYLSLRGREGMTHLLEAATAMQVTGASAMHIVELIRAAAPSAGGERETLADRLLAIRNRAIAKGMTLLDADEIIAGASSAGGEGMLSTIETGKSVPCQYCGAYVGTAEGWHDRCRIKALEDALSLRGREGMVEVPREPTKAMLDAGYKAAVFPRDPEICIAMWKAMLSAAPSAGGERQTLADRLLAIRNRAIAKGMTLLDADEIIAGAPSEGGEGK